MAFRRIIALYLQHCQHFIGAHCSYNAMHYIVFLYFFKVMEMLLLMLCCMQPLFFNLTKLSLLCFFCGLKMQYFGSYIRMENKKEL